MHHLSKSCTNQTPIRRHACSLSTNALNKRCWTERWKRERGYWILSAAVGGNKNWRSTAFSESSSRDNFRFCFFFACSNGGTLQRKRERGPISFFFSFPEETWGADDSGSPAVERGAAIPDSDDHDQVIVIIPVILDAHIALFVVSGGAMPNENELVMQPARCKAQKYLRGCSRSGQSAGRRSMWS